MRVGLVAKGLLLKGDLDLELVLLCKEKPTIGLLEKVADNLGTQLAVSMKNRQFLKVYNCHRLSFLFFTCSWNKYNVILLYWVMGFHAKECTEFLLFCQLGYSNVMQFWIKLLNLSKKHLFTYF